MPVFYRSNIDAAALELPTINYAPAQLAQARKALVVRVYDCDTVQVADAACTWSVRLIGIDGPEFRTHRQQPDRYAADARAALADLVDGMQVHVIPSLLQSPTDRYGRSTGFLVRAFDMMDANAEMIRQGWAYARLDYPHEFKSQFLLIQRWARRHRRGLWGLPKAPAPFCKKEPS